MRQMFWVIGTGLLIAGLTTGTSGAQCTFQHPKKGKVVETSLVQAFIPCDASTCVGGWNEGGACTTDADCPAQGPESTFCYASSVNASTDIGVISCKPPLTYNEAKGSPPNGWRWGPNGWGTVSFKPTKNKLVNPSLNPVPNTADVEVRLDLVDVEDADGLVDGSGTLVPLRRTTFEDRAGGDMTVVDLSLPSFQVPVVRGRARVKTSANAWLNEEGFPGVPGCTSLELVDLQLFDENYTLFARPGIFVPDINPN